MSEKETNQQSDFLSEKIKGRPINKSRLVRRTIITATFAVVFGLIASFTFLLLQPMISKLIYPEEPMPQVYFPEDSNEMSPEDMLADNLPPDSERDGDAIDIGENATSQMVMEAADVNYYKQMYKAMADYVQELKHSVVYITGIRSNVDWLNNVQEKQYQTCGLLIARNLKEYYVLTEYSPIQEAQRFAIAPGFDNHYSITAELKSYDIITNLAVLSIKMENIPEELLEEDGIQVATMGTSNLRNLEGSPIVAIGTPMGTLGSVGYGMITAASGQFSTVDSNYKLLQTDINGSQKAGGILFNLNGEVLGVITTSGNTYDMKNLISAYGITDLKARMEKMTNNKKIAYLGVIGGNVTAVAHNEQGVPYGAYVSKVAMDSPAMEAGIQQGDVIISIDGRSITSFSEYTNVMMQLEVGQTVPINVVRFSQNEFKEMPMEIVLGAIK